MFFFSSLLDWIAQKLVDHFGWLYVLYIHLPLTFVHHRTKIIWDWFRLRLQLARHSHPRKVAAVQREVRKWNEFGRPKHQKMCTGAGWDTCQRICFTRPAYKRGMHKIHLDTLSDIIEINTSAQFVRAEPLVTVDHLLRALLPCGYTLPIVPELGCLTVGGLINGCGIGSGSARHGLFQHICLAYEMVTPSGELLIAEKKKGEHQSLFYGIPWSLGTLGFLVSATIQIQPCPAFVRLVYQPCLSINELCGFQEEMHPRAGNDFVEGIQFDKNQGMLLTGKFVDQVPKNERKSLNRIGQWHKPYFYEHVRKMLARHGTTKVEYIPAGQYFRRHWRSLFWELRSVLPPFIAGTFPFRWMLDWLLAPAVPFLPKLQRMRRMLACRHVLQNFLLPAKNVPETLAMLNERLQVFPIWLCPFVLPAQPGLLRNRQGLKSIYVNIGIYGEVPASARGREGGGKGEKEIRKKMTAIEGHIRNVQGFQMICTDTNQTAAEFWDMFDATLYDWLRAKYDCKTALPNVYEKLDMANREL